MKIANVKGIAAKAAVVAMAAGTLMFAGAAQAQAQHFSVGVQLGRPAYVAPAYAYYGNGYRGRDDFRYDRDARWREEAREREQREAFEQRQAYLRHEQWEHQQRFDRDDRR